MIGLNNFLYTYLQLTSLAFLGRKATLSDFVVKLTDVCVHLKVFVLNIDRKTQQICLFITTKPHIFLTTLSDSAVKPTDVHVRVNIKDLFHLTKR